MKNERKQNETILACNNGLPIFENVDCIQFYVSDLEEGMDFYRDALGLKLLWKTKDSCGLGTQKGIAEIVLVNEHNPMVDLKVSDVELELELQRFIRAGGKLIYGPFDIDIGKCAVVFDPWDNQYCIFDMTKGTYDVDDNSKVMGVSKK